MLPFERILFPVDYSDACKAIAPYVTETARHFKASLTLAHAYHVWSVPHEEVVKAANGWPQRIKPYEKNRLREFAASFFPGLDPEFRVEEGDAGEVIHHIIEHEGTDLVMMPSRGRGIVRRLLLGSTTAKVLHDSSAAVWTCGQSLQSAQPHYQSILCAVDESEEAEAVAKAAAYMAKSYKARLTLMHVLQYPQGVADLDLSPYQAAMKEASCRKLREMNDRLNLNASYLVSEEPFLEAILHQAEAVHADLIVAGRGMSQGTFSRVWSSLCDIVRESPCPVLSI